MFRIAVEGAGRARKSPEKPDWPARTRLARKQARSLCPRQVRNAKSGYVTATGCRPPSGVRESKPCEDKR